MAAHQAPPSLGLSRQEHRSGLPFPSPMHESEKWKWSCSVVSDPQRPHGLQPSRVLRPWDFPGKSTGVGCHFLLQCMKMKSESEVSQSCPTLSDPMDFVAFSQVFVNWFLHFLHFVFKVFDHLYYHYSKSFLGSLPISSSFIWTSVFLVCSFICVVFLPFHCYYFLTYCVWGLLFPGFKVEFFLLFGFCPPKVGPVVSVSFI